MNNSNIKENIFDFFTKTYKVWQKLFSRGGYFHLVYQRFPMPSMILQKYPAQKLFFAFAKTSLFNDAEHTSDTWQKLIEFGKQDDFFSAVIELKQTLITSILPRFLINTDYCSDEKSNMYKSHIENYYCGEHSYTQKKLLALLREQCR